MSAETSGVIIEARGVVKRFGGVRAIDGVDVIIARGEVHAFVGENGAGKSTLGKMVSGVLAPDAGEILVDGQSVHFRSPRDALRNGIALIAQELALVPQRSVMENVFLGIEGGVMGFQRGRRLRERYEALAEQSGLGLSANARVGDLRIADQQKVEILRALARQARVIVMDEPTAALTRQEADQLLVVIDSLRQRGTTVIYVSHFLRELLQVSDAVTVLKDGELVRTARAASETPETLVESMLGRPASMAFPAKTRTREDAPIVLSVRELRRPPALVSASLDVRAGEIVGIAGLVGSGRSELARAIFGADKPASGEVVFQGGPAKWRRPYGAVAQGVAMVPESRKEQGLMMSATVLDNVLVSHRSSISRLGFVSTRRERSTAQRILEAVGATAGRLNAAVSTLSGGNQQKIALGKWLLRTPTLLIVDEPTRGVDVAAKSSIYELLTGYAAAGMAIVVISSELEEVLGLAHRVLVMRRGQIVADVPAEDATAQSILNKMLVSEE